MPNICKNCLVELDDQMEVCPLCGLSANAPAQRDPQGHIVVNRPSESEERFLMHRILWQIAATLLLSGIVATMIIDVTAHKGITWSAVPGTICLTFLCYALLFAYWRTRLIYRLVVGWLISTIALLALISVFPEKAWIGALMIPLLFSVNIAFVALLAIFRASAQKSLNLFAYSFVALAVLCLVIDGIVSRFLSGEIRLDWSIIVAACLLPVTAVLIFVFYRTRNNATIQKIFHT